MIIDFTGRVEGKWFEGGTGTDVVVNIGSGTFLPGFEDQLTGTAAGEQKQVKITFPANYANSQLAGKEAEFDVTVKSIEAPGGVTIDDAFAKTLRAGACSISSSRPSGNVCSRISRQPVGSGSSGSSWTGWMRCTGSLCPPVWPKRSSRTSGPRCKGI